MTTTSAQYRALCDATGLSQQALADRLGIHKSTLLRRFKDGARITPEMVAGVEAVTKPREGDE